MPTFSLSDIRSRSRLSSHPGKTFDSSFAEQVRKHAGNKNVDIYLSHPGLEPELVFGAILTLEDFGYSVCVDQFVDQKQAIFQIDSEREEHRRSLIYRCRGMICLTTTARSESRWLPWECGYFAGEKKRVAVMPITPANSEMFRGEDFLGLYPFITRYQSQNQRMTLVVKFGTKVYCTLDTWFKGGAGLLEG